MKRYPVAVLRERLAEALDAAYQGVPVVIERKGVRYRLTRETRPAKKSGRRARMFEILDPAVMAGNWSWAWTPGAMTFVPGPSGAPAQPPTKPAKTARKPKQTAGRRP